MDRATRPLKGMGPFLSVIFANLVSVTGSQMTRFAVIAWAWQMTGSATAAGLIAMCSFGGTVVASAFAGALVDRWNRKRTIIVTDVVSGITTASLLALYLTGNLEVWHLGVVGAVAGVLESLQFPAYMSAVTTMVPQEQYARANGMFQLVWQGSAMIAPVLAAGVVALWGMLPVFVFDMLTFTVVVATVGLVHIPQPPAPEEGHGSIWADIVEGFRYIWERPGLAGMLILILVVNIACGAYEGVFRPMVLARTGSETVLGQALLAVGLGGLSGGFLMSAWGGPKGQHKVKLILGSLTALCAFGLMVLGFGQSLWVWVAAGAAYGFFEAIGNTLIFTLWQQKVDPAIQGRVFNTLRMVGLGSTPLAILGATQLADKVLEPAMTGGGALADMFGGLVGTGQGAGMGLVLGFAGIFGILGMLLGFLSPSVRNAETALPDHSEAA
jgi:MFS transporter, DHA3 family, macrolide efflux protein